MAEGRHDRRHQPITPPSPPMATTAPPPPTRGRRVVRPSVFRRLGSRDAAGVRHERPTTAKKALIRRVDGHKQEMCRNFMRTGACQYGDDCIFLHIEGGGASEKKRRGDDCAVSAESNGRRIRRTDSPTKPTAERAEQPTDADADDARSLEQRRIAIKRELEKLEREKSGPTTHAVAAPAQRKESTPLQKISISESEGAVSSSDSEEEEPAQQRRPRFDEPKRVEPVAVAAASRTMAECAEATVQQRRTGQEQHASDRKRATEEQRHTTDYPRAERRTLSSKIVRPSTRPAERPKERPARKGDKPRVDEPRRAIQPSLHAREAWNARRQRTRQLTCADRSRSAHDRPPAPPPPAWAQAAFGGQLPSLLDLQVPLPPPVAPRRAERPPAPPYTGGGRRAAEPPQRRPTDLVQEPRTLAQPDRSDRSTSRRRDQPRHSRSPRNRTLDGSQKRPRDSSQVDTRASGASSSRDQKRARPLTVDAAAASAPSTSAERDRTRPTIQSKAAKRRLARSRAQLRRRTNRQAELHSEARDDTREDCQQPPPSPDRRLQERSSSKMESANAIAAAAAVELRRASDTPDQRQRARVATPPHQLIDELLLMEAVSPEAQSEDDEMAAADEPELTAATSADDQPASGHVWLDDGSKERKGVSVSDAASDALVDISDDEFDLDAAVVAVSPRSDSDESVDWAQLADRQAPLEHVSSARERFAQHRFLRTLAFCPRQLSAELTARIEAAANDVADADERRQLGEFRLRRDESAAEHSWRMADAAARRRLFVDVDGALSAAQDMQLRRRLCGQAVDVGAPPCWRSNGAAVQIDEESRVGCDHTATQPNVELMKRTQALLKEALSRVRGRPEYIEQVVA